LDELAESSNAPLLQVVYLSRHFWSGVESKLRAVKRARPDVLVAYEYRILGPSGETSDAYFPYGQRVHVDRWRFPSPTEIREGKVVPDDVVGFLAAVPHLAEGPNTEDDAHARAPFHREQTDKFHSAEFSSWHVFE
jgi:hypothetical protein